MSVILYENEKFNRIYESLKPKGREIAHIWNYPNGWDKSGMDEVLRNFVNDLCRANIITWNQQYPDNVHPLEVVEFKAVNRHGEATLPYQNNYELLKSLRGLSYNLVTNDGAAKNLLGCADKLRRVIEYVMRDIIDKIPKYEEALTW